MEDAEEALSGCVRPSLALQDTGKDCGRDSKERGRGGNEGVGGMREGGKGEKYEGRKKGGRYKESDGLEE